MQGFEGLGTFYLGKAYDLDDAQRGEALVLYDARDLVTHAVIVGMTGSGKTGLGTVLIEEAALDGIPAVVIDPKGDLANVLLSFPELRPEDFRPWVSSEDAARAELSEDALAAREAGRWRAGLLAWGQDGERIARVRAAAEFRLYTPGSSAARPLSILKSFAVPDAAVFADEELLREKVAAASTALLTLLGIDADPLKSREHTLLASLVQRAWSEGRDVDLGTLIREVQAPPFERVGVLDLESFFPTRERMDLALRLNQLLASPSFAAWLAGDPLDVAALFTSPAGRPRVSVLSIAHLSDAERMFFLSLLFSELIAWMRRQPGTGSLRALVYMDEVAGYLPPVANPPTKPPLLMLLKQARAFGLGFVLATQNPADLDYKALSNAGTWFIGKLTTERDKLRLMDGLEGAAAGTRLDRAALERILSALSARVFLMNDVHEDAPQVFETRWALSYLRGPMTRAELKRLAAETEEVPREASAAAGTPASARAGGAAVPAARPEPAAELEPVTQLRRLAPPILPPDVPQVFLEGPVPPEGSRTYEPHLLARASVYFNHAKLGLRSERELAFLVPCLAGTTTIDWRAAREVTEASERPAPEPGSTFAELASSCAQAKALLKWGRALADHLARTQTLDLFRSPATKLTSEPDETEREFRSRLALSRREQRDAETEKLRRKYAPRFATLQDKIRRAEQKIAVQAEQARSAKLSGWLSAGTALLGAFTGRKLGSVGNASRAATAARGVGRAQKEASDVERAHSDLADARAKLAELESEFAAVAAATASPIDATAEKLELLQLAPKKKDVVVRSIALAWVPDGFDGAVTR
jgi:hypothetical protein